MEGQVRCCVKKRESATFPGVSHALVVAAEMQTAAPEALVKMQTIPEEPEEPEKHQEKAIAEMQTPPVTPLAIRRQGKSGVKRHESVQNPGKNYAAHNRRQTQLQ